MKCEQPKDDPVPNISDRQCRTKRARVLAMKHQTATQDAANQPRYDQWAGLTPDEKDTNTSFKNYAASFNKLLEHDQHTGLLTDPGSPKSGVDSYQHLLNGLEVYSPSSGFDQGELNLVRLAVDPSPDPKVKRRVIINPQSGKSLNIKGGDIAAYVFKKITVKDSEKAWNVGYEVRYAEDGDTKDLLDELSFRSPYSAAEMVEVYGMALLRTFSFSSYNPAYQDVQIVLDALNAFPEFRGPKEDVGSGNYHVTAKTLFRGNSPESLRGSYLSKFFFPLRRPPQFASGCAPGTGTLTNAEIFFDQFAQYYEVPRPNRSRAFGLTWEDYVAIQNGRIPDHYQPGDLVSNDVITNGLILASEVHLDSLYQEYAWAVDVLTGGDYPRTPVSPYTRPPAPDAFSAKNEGDGPTLGPPDAAGLVGAVALAAARAAWGMKYNVARRARPEVFAALIHKRLDPHHPQNYGPIDNRLVSDPKVRRLLDRIKEQNGQFVRYMPSTGDPHTYLLSQVFPEAAPAHPAWTSGHATVGGACVTVIKAIFDDTQPLRQQVPGDPPPPFTDNDRPDGVPLTVGGELDKLASNVALGRNFGGVHFRSDGEHGILLGEAVAIHFLQDHLRTYREKFRSNADPDGKRPFFELTRRSGQRIRITADDVTPVTTVAAGAAEGSPSVHHSADRSTL